MCAAGLRSTSYRAELCALLSCAQAMCSGDFAFPAGSDGADSLLQALRQPCFVDAHQSLNGSQLVPFLGHTQGRHRAVP